MVTQGFRAVIRRMIIEQEVKLAQDSLDDQIDSILLRFESDSIIDDGQEEPPIASEGLIDLRTLLEAPGDEEKDEDKGDEAPEDDAGDTGVPPDDEHEDMPEDMPDQEAEPMHPKIDVSKFALKVVRLITSYKNLLDIPLVIATRAYNYLLSNYDTQIADMFRDVLSGQGIELEKQSSPEPETLPIAVGAAASGLGGP